MQSVASMILTTVAFITVL